MQRKPSLSNDAAQVNYEEADKRLGEDVVITHIDDVDDEAIEHRIQSIRL
jgi:hypothetical protein